MWVFSSDSRQGHIFPRKPDRGKQPSPHPAWCTDNALRSQKGVQSSTQSPWLAVLKCLAAFLAQVPPSWGLFMVGGGTFGETSYEELRRDLENILLSDSVLSAFPLLAHSHPLHPGPWSIRLQEPLVRGSLSGKMTIVVLVHLPFIQSSTVHEGLEAATCQELKSPQFIVHAFF